MVTVIAGREWKSLFLSPLAWTILGVVMFILAWLFLAQLDLYLTLAPQIARMPEAPGVTDVVIAPLLSNTGVILLLVVPLITMRALSEERRSQTLVLLLASPVSMTRIVLGKYLGLMGFFAVLLALIAAMLLSLSAGTHLDYGKLAAGLLGLLLLVAAFVSAGLYMSSLTDQPTIAAVATFGLLLLFWIIDWAGAAGAEGSALFGYLSLLNHYQSLLKGIFNTSDVLYYLLFSVTFLGLTVERLDAQRVMG